ncbi:MAG TPA: transcription elongation factor GreA [Candidatus Paceibacterota bacterium]
MEEDKVYLSKEKLEELTKELEYLRSVGRKEIAQKLEYAKSLGDLSENAEYQDARDAQAIAEDRISTLETLLKSAVVISGKKGDVIDVGSIVSIKKNGEGTERTFTLVGSEEANIAQGKISNKSPMGEAMVGKKKGDAFVFRAPSGEAQYTIVDVK